MALVGLGVAGVHMATTGQGDCDWNGKNWVIICYNTWTLPHSDAFTLGSTINTTLDKSEFADRNCGRLLAHETKQGDQWAMFGGNFVPLLGLDWTQARLRTPLHGGPAVATRTLAENWAGLADGGYSGPGSCGC